MSQKSKELLNEMRQSLERKNDFQAQLSSLEGQLSDPALAISRLKLDIMQYQNILAQAEPKATYRIDGEYCINGIRNCTNHPPRQVQTNKDEVERFRRNQADARDAIHRLNNEINRLEAESRSIKNQYNEINRALQLQNLQDESLQNESSRIKREVTDNDRALSLAKTELTGLLDEKNRLSANLENAKSNSNQLSNYENALDLNLMQIQQNIESAKQELIQEQQNHNAMMAEEAIQNELNKEAKNKLPATAGSYSNISEQLRRIAEQELAAEQKTQSPSVYDNTLADRAIDGAIDSAYSSGTISGYVRNNLKGIKGFLNQQVRNMGNDLDSANKEFNK